MKKARKIFFIVLGLILFVVICLDTYLVLKYNVLPTKYLILYAVLVGLIPILMICYTLFRKKHQKVKGTFAIIEIIYIIVLFIAFGYLNKTFKFLDVFTSAYDYETKNYYVITLKDSDINKIEELENKTIGYSSSFDNSSQHAITELNKKTKIKSEDFESYTDLYHKLDDNSIDATLMFSNSYDMLVEDETETENEDSITDKYKIIYNFSIKEEIKPMEDKSVDITKEAFNIYISGMDSFGSITDKSRSDVNIVMSVNPKTNKILLVTIPRDYYVDLHGTGQKDKLTHAGIYGIDMSINTIEDLLDIDINYYIKVNFNAVIKLVDALGGIDVFSDYNFTSGYYYITFKKGINHLNGKGALEFARTRKAFKDGDRVRGEHQQKIIEAVVNKLCSPSLLMKYDDILKSLEGNFTTNLSTDNITNIIKMQLDKMPKWTFESLSLNGTDSHGITYSAPSQELYVMLPDQETVDIAKEALKKNS